MAFDTLHDPAAYEESPDYRPEVMGVLHSIYDTNHRRELGAFSGKTLCMLGLERGFSDDEIQLVANAISDQKGRLTAPDEAFRVPDLPEVVIFPEGDTGTEPWSPTSSIVEGAPERPRDVRELAANDH